jgi:hypothetical protein
MPAPYRELLQRIRTAFPQPVSDRIHDSYFVHSIMRALDQVDALKSELPLLGGNVPPDYEAARRADLRPNLAALEAVTSFRPPNRRKGTPCDARPNGPAPTVNGGAGPWTRR